MRLLPSTQGAHRWDRVSMVSRVQLKVSFSRHFFLLSDDLLETSELTGSPGPLRHPKPLTPSDLHMVLEKEQEAMVSSTRTERLFLIHRIPVPNTSF